jgi:hypothetical protein
MSISDLPDPSSCICPVFACVAGNVYRIVAGEWTFHSTGLLWRDIIGYINVDEAGANAFGLNVFRGGNIRMYSGAAADKIDMVFHIPHDYALGTDLYIHHHWSHNGTAISGNFVCTYSHTYADGYTREAFAAEKTIVSTYSTVNIATTPRWEHMITEEKLSVSGGSATQLDSDTIEVDGLILVNFTLTTIPTITGGSPNEPFILTIDLHYQSTDIGTPNRNYPFV